MGLIPATRPGGIRSRTVWPRPYSAASTGLCASGVHRDIGRGEAQVPGWVDHSNQEAPRSALGMQALAEFYATWLVKNKTQPAHN
jgi:hypothetical protein